MIVCPIWDKKLFPSTEALEAADYKHRINVTSGWEFCICSSEDDKQKYMARRERRKTWWGRIVDLWLDVRA